MSASSAIADRHDCRGRDAGFDLGMGELEHNAFHVAEWPKVALIDPSSRQHGHDGHAPVDQIDGVANCTQQLLRCERGGAVEKDARVVA